MANVHFTLFVTYTFAQDSTPECPVYLRKVSLTDDDTHEWYRKPYQVVHSVNNWLPIEALTLLRKHANGDGVRVKIVMTQERYTLGTEVVPVY